MATSSKLFSFNDIRNKPSRNGFDLSRRMAFTGKISELLPVCVIKTFPGDKFKIRTQHFTRTSPVQTAAFVRIREYFDWFYVPYRLLWRNWQSMSVNMTEQPVMARSITENSEVSTQQPYLMLSDISTDAWSNLRASREMNYFNFSRIALWAKLFNYFGYGRSNLMSEVVKSGTANDSVDINDNDYTPLYDIPVDIFPIAAYHKVYNDYFRNSQWEAQTPYLWNFDYSDGGLLSFPNAASSYWTGKTLFDMEYCNVPKDLFFGILPNQQLGDIAKVALEGESGNVVLPIPSVVANGSAVSIVTQQNPTNPLGTSQVNGTTASLYRTGASFTSTSEQLKTQQISVSVPSRNVTVPASAFQVNLDIISLRQAEFLQKYKEIAQSGDQSYRDQVYKIWGVSLPDSLSDTCMWINGSSSNIDISEVLNTNFTDAYNEDGTPVSEPYIKGKGVGVGDDMFDFSTKEHGVILCVYHAQPILDYDISGIDLQLTHTDWSDYPNPAFDKIGFESLPIYSFINNKKKFGITIPTADFGFVPRYISAKTAVDRICGGFSFGLNDWVAPINDEYIEQYAIGGDTFEGVDYNFFKIHPALLDSIFGLKSDSFVETDQFRINAYFDIKAVRNFDYNGLPY